MPYMFSDKACKVCQNSGLFRQRLTTWNINPKLILISTCKECERKVTQKHQKDNREYWRALNRTSYFKTSEGNTSRRNNMAHTEESRKQQARDKANRRCGRAKQARFDDEFTKLVTAEAHDLRKRRNEVFGFEWHVDHVLPLKGKNVCGLHIWSNLQVIPKVQNLRKGIQEVL